MSMQPDINRSVRAWLVAEAPERAPGRLLDASRDRLRTTPQRRAWWPAWRFSDMNSYAKVGAAGVAVLALAIVGFNLLPATGGQPVGGPAASASTSPSAPTSSSPSPESRAWPLPGELGAQEYHVTVDGVPFSFALPSDGWRSVTAGELLTGEGSPHTARGDDYAWLFLPGGDMDAVATDPCNGLARKVNASTLDEYAAELATIPGLSAEQPVDTTLAGLPAKVVTLTVDPDPPCDINSFWLGGDRSLHPNSVDSIIRIWITFVDGQRHAVFTDQASADPRVEREIQQIIDSYQLE